MNTTFDFVELFSKDVLAQLVKEAENRDWGAAQYSYCVPSEQARLGCQLTNTDVRDTACCVPTASCMDKAGRDPGVLSHKFYCQFQIYFLPRPLNFINFEQMTSAYW